MNFKEILRRWRHEWKMKTSPSYANRYRAEQAGKLIVEGFVAGYNRVRDGGRFDGFTDEQLAFMKRYSSLLTPGYDEEE